MADGIVKQFDPTELYPFAMSLEPTSANSSVLRMIGV
jgi:hypothetical protein